MLNTVILIIPILLLFVAVEWIISHRRGDHRYNGKNFAMNLAIGAIDQLGSLFYFVALYVVMQYVFGHFRLFTLNEKWYTWIIAYIVIDFVSYWYHRFSHRINFLWAGHITHHSSEYLNFSNGFRTSLFQGFNRILFIGFIPVFGFSPLMLLVTFKISGLYDFLLHTTYVPKLGILEKFLVTPSHHRVHHGRNDIYIDKNYSSTFIVWDKMFGTFQEETEEVEYGIKGKYVDDNPVNAVTYYYKFMFRIMRERRSWGEKLSVFFISPERTKPDADQCAEEGQDEKSLGSYFSSYAWFQLSLAVPGMILLLFYMNYLPGWIFAIIAACGVSSICSGALLLNGGSREHTLQFEIGRKILFILLLGIVCWFLPEFWMLFPLYFEIVSLVILVHAREKFLMRGDVVEQ